MSAHELDIARQLIALAALLRGDWYHIHFAVRPALFEAAVGLADLLRPELGNDAHVPLFEGTDEDGRHYKPGCASTTRRSTTVVTPDART